MKPAHSFTTNTPPPQHSFGTSQRTGFGKVRGNMGHDGSSISHTTNGQLVNEVAAALEQQTISRHNTYISHGHTTLTI
uniref:Uncharacterized protein n=1 Tax=Heterorhabditis bacteriophora TaxID=37862 RepID=A0A1I7WPC2_HETBA